MINYLEDETDFLESSLELPDLSPSFLPEVVSDFECEPLSFEFDPLVSSLLECVAVAVWLKPAFLSLESSVDPDFKLEFGILYIH